MLLGIADDDSAADAIWLAGKIARIRIFTDEAGLMNRDILAGNGEVLVVSQFTLLADYKKGNRPSFLRAAKTDKAIPLYEFFNEQLEQILGKPPQTGVFGADMQVALVNNGPVAIMMDSKIRT